MTKATQTKPNTLDDSALDEISGGPHFRTWDNTYYDYHGGCDVVLAKNSDVETSSGHYTQVVWAKS